MNLPIIKCGGGPIGRLLWMWWFIWGGGTEGGGVVKWFIWWGINPGGIPKCRGIPDCAVIGGGGGCCIRALSASKLWGCRILNNINKKFKPFYINSWKIDIQYRIIAKMSFNL